jgi:hypothetical protein
MRRQFGGLFFRQNEVHRVLKPWAFRAVKQRENWQIHLPTLALVALSAKTYNFGFHLHWISTFLL